MRYHGIDSALAACDDPDAASAAYDRLGLTVGSASAAQRSLRVGDFTLYLLADTGEPLAEPLAAARAAGRSLFAVALAVPDLAAAVRRLHKHGVRAVTSPAVAWLPLAEQAGLDLLLVERAEPTPPPAHRFPLLRLDHLAAVAYDLDAKAHFWQDVLGVKDAGEVVTPTLRIRQLRLGDAILELLGAASADSPIHHRPAGLVGMASWEVADLDEAVRLARAAGFPAPDPAPGPLPGTRISTIPGTELAGVNMQLLEYARPAA
jgi:catechol 2,3-dioxygenase-like lactoylglutathione lyase family enzyme